jgi:hypothetical protein
MKNELLMAVKKLKKFRAELVDRVEGIGTIGVGIKTRRCMASA